MADSSRYSTNKDEKAVAAEQRFQQQCYLITQMVKGRPAFINKRTKGGKPYKHFTCLQSSDGGAGTVVSTLTSIGKAQALLGITSEQLAYLVPTIRLFKVFEEPGKRNPLEREFKFNEGSFIASEHQDADMILMNRGGRGADIGVESVSFELLATQPAEITNNITCTIKLFFKNLASLEEPMGQVIDGIPSVKASDLILRSKTGNDTGEYQPEYYRLKLHVGWALPAGNDALHSDAKKSDALKDALRRSQTVLNLTLKSHEFDFEMDGTSSLTIEYQAWVEGALSSDATDLFQPDEIDRIALQELKKELEEEQEAAKAEESFGQEGAKSSTGANAGAGAGGAAPPTPPNAANPPKPPGGGGEEGEKDRAQEIQDEIKEIEERTAAARYKELLNMLLGKGGQNPALKYIDVDPKMVGSEMQGDEQVKRSEMAKTRCDEAASSTAYHAGADYEGARADNNPLGGILGGGGGILGGAGASGTAKAAAAVNDAYSGDKLPDNLDGFQKAIDDLGTPPGAAGRIRVNYMFFGDLLDVALTMLDKHLRYKMSPASRITLLLGPCFIANPCEPTKYVAMNIADIPINLNLFLSWFKQTVLDKKIKKYLLRNFINDILGKLFAPALGSDCFENVRQTFRVHADVLNLRGLGGSGTVKPIKKGLVLTKQAVGEIVKRIDYSGGVNKKTHDYMLLYGYGMSPSNLSANRFSDEMLGIYHFHLGQDRGIVKNISFSKNDAPYLGEAKVLGKGDVGADLAGGAIYNADLDLVGNGLFVPGQYVYINPRSLGLGTTNNPESMSHRLRLGGYYLVHKVSSELSSGDFTTKISGIWETGGKVTPDPVEEVAGSGNGEPKEWEGEAWSGDEAKAWASNGSGNENAESDPSTGPSGW